ncbi:hypothetical protein VTH06DRAFT_7060 [Thermothelomyces fergusii]
MLDDYVIGPI